jgi:hypothetical protein
MTDDIPAAAINRAERAIRLATIALDELSEHDCYIAYAPAISEALRPAISALISTSTDIVASRRIFPR